MEIAVLLFNVKIYRVNIKNDEWLEGRLNRS